VQDGNWYWRCAALVCALSAHAVCVTAQQVRDSAGVRIVSYERNAAPKHRWTLESKPILEIGRNADEGPTAFAGIAGVVRLSDGRIAVANVKPSEIRLYSSSGAFQRALGRNGQGPGEFNQQLFRLLRSGDSLIGIDNNMRAQIFEPRGEMARSLARPRPPAAASAPARLAFDSRGNAIVHAVDLPAKPPAPGEMHYVKLFRETGDGEAYAELLRVPAYEATEGQPGLNFVVYGPAGRIAASNTHICTGFSNEFAITCHDHAGRARTIVRRSLLPRSISDADRSFYRDMVLSTTKRAPPDVVAKIEETVRSTQFASRAPAFGRLMLAQSGDIWVSEFDRSEMAVGSSAARTTQVPLRWSVFSSEGEWLSDLTLPARFTPHEMGTDYVLGVSLDAEDGERVTLYRIRR